MSDAPPEKKGKLQPPEKKAKLQSEQQGGSRVAAGAGMTALNRAFTFEFRCPKCGDVSVFVSVFAGTSHFELEPNSEASEAEVSVGKGRYVYTSFAAFLEFRGWPPS
jgi:predicted RNA-binding Zn-ribbon protein involved in translation (DUF1610 family)